MATKQTQDIDLGLTRREWDRPDGRIQTAALSITTDKGFGSGLRSSAQVYWLAPNSRSCALGIGGGGDFSKTLATNKTARATQKAIDTLHAQTFTPETIAALTAEALNYYATGQDKR